jgi:hypothetical protein
MWDAKDSRSIPGSAASASAIGALAIHASAASRRVGVRRGQHPQERGATPGAGRLSPSANARDGPGPFESGMHRCRLLTVLFAHRKKPPSRNATLGRRVHALPFPWAVGNTYHPRHCHSWRITTDFANPSQVTRGSPPRDDGVLNGTTDVGLLIDAADAPARPPRTLSQSDGVPTDLTRDGSRSGPREPHNSPSGWLLPGFDRPCGLDRSTQNLSVEAGAV